MPPGNVKQLDIRHWVTKGGFRMGDERRLRRIDNPEGHQVCQVDQDKHSVAIQNRNYLTTIRFDNNGKCIVAHQRVEKLVKTESR